MRPTMMHKQNLGPHQGLSHPRDQGYSPEYLQQHRQHNERSQGSRRRRLPHHLTVDTASDFRRQQTSAFQTVSRLARRFKSSLLSHNTRVLLLFFILVAGIQWRKTIVQRQLSLSSWLTVGISSASIDDIVRTAGADMLMLHTNTLTSPTTREEIIDDQKVRNEDRVDDDFDWTKPLEEPFSFPSSNKLPFVYHTSHQVVHPTLYRELAKDFPPVPQSVITGLNAVGNKSIRRTDAAYAELLGRSRAWRKLDEFVYSQKMIDYGMKLFGDALQDESRCFVDPTKATYVDQNETLYNRDPVTGSYPGGGIRLNPYYQRRHEQIGDPNQLYVVMDFFHGPGNITGRPERAYSFNRHLDYPFRVFSILLYFTDTDETTGGNLDIYNGTDIHKSIAIRENGGVSHFSPHPLAWHGVQTYTQPDTYRKLIQIQASSSWVVCRDAVKKPGSRRYVPTN